MRYRRNADADLRGLERQYNAYPSREMLQHIDATRLRMGLPPHPATRAAAAKDLLSFKEVRCLQLLRDAIQHGPLAAWRLNNNALLQAEAPEEWDWENPYPQILQDIVTKAEEMFVIRSAADNDTFVATRGLPPEPDYMELVASRGIILTGEAPDLSNVPEHHFAPGMAAALGTSEIGSRIDAITLLREEADHTCYLLLAQAAQLGFFSYAHLMEVYEEDEEEALGQFEEVQESLNECRLANEELMAALLGRAPDPAYVEELAGDSWYSHQ